MSRFLGVCRTGILALAQSEYKTLKYPIDPLIIKKAFELACTDGNLELAQWLYGLNPDFEIPSNDEEQLFRHSCRHLYIVKWLYEMKPTIDISIREEEAFRNACYNGKLELAQWLYHVKPTIHVSALNDFAFEKACYNKHLHVAQWLYHIKPTIHVSDAVFENACWHGDVPLIQWLYQINTGIASKTATIENVFRVACMRNNIVLMKWLYQINPNIDISAEYHYAFIHAGQRVQVDMLKWLYSIRPDYYILEIENNRIVKYMVRPESDQNWNKRKWALCSHLYDKNDRTTKNLFRKLPFDMVRIICKMI